MNPSDTLTALSLTVGAIALRYTLTAAGRALDRHVERRATILRRLMA